MEEIGSPVPIWDCLLFQWTVEKVQSWVETVRSCAQDFPKRGWLEEPHPSDLLIFNWLKGSSVQPEGCLCGFFWLSGFSCPAPSIYLKALSKRWAIQCLCDPTLTRGSSNVLMHHMIRARLDWGIDDIPQVYLQSMYLQLSIFGFSRPLLTSELPSFPAHMQNSCHLFKD